VTDEWNIGGIVLIGKMKDLLGKPVPMSLQISSVLDWN
jgi:hypothetical protein